MSDEGLTRREVLTRGAGAVVAAGVAASAGYFLHDSEGDAGLPRSSDTGHQLRNYFNEVDFPASNPRVSIATGGEERIEQMVRAALGGLAPGTGMKQFIAKDDVVLVKPNVGFDRAPQLGATTHPEVLRWVLRLCREAGARRLIVTDNPIESAEACFAKSGIGKVADAERADVVLPSQGQFEALVIRDHQPDRLRGEALGRWPILYGPLAEATKVIGLAPIKDHNLCSASMNLKNWYGLLGGRRNQFHQAIHNIVSDLGLMVSPTLVIGDGTRVMMQNGPTGGRLTDVRPGGVLGRPAIVASVDPVACDAWCYRDLLGRDPARLPYIELAHEKINAQIASGIKRFAERDLRAYESRGMIVTTSV